MRVMVVEDDLELCRVLHKHLVSAGYAVDAFSNAEEACAPLSECGAYDAAILDIQLPGMDGLTLLQKAREKGSRTPVLLLTVRGTVQDRVRGLDAGADDYMVKPFAYEELDARLRALIRRGPAQRGSILEVDGLRLDASTRRVTRDGKDIRLSGREFALLEYMMHNEGVVLTREQIEKHIWNAEIGSASNVVDVYIRYLRRKIDDGVPLKLIHTIRGAGYRLSTEE
ncbi:MAG: response regulator transcription factor [Clostridia bacterium]|nr:response regulator transcription factor [Clostridia bacterium]